MRIATVRILALCTFLALYSGLVTAQEPRRVTISTLKGETVEGTMKGASASELIIEIAGQEMRIPLANIKLVSFVGKIDAAPAASTTPLAAALQALKELRAATEIGMLRDQYAQKLVETLPRVREFIRSTEDWKDTRMAMERAIDQYQKPLADLASWKDAGTAMTIGGKYADYAALLASDANEERHQESPSEQSLTIGRPVTGRLGFGDRMMSRELDRSSEASFNDVFRFTVPTETELTVTMTCTPCTPHLTLTDGNGRKLEGDAGYSGRSTIKRKFTPGTYVVWAGGMGVAEVGSYELTATKQQR